MVTSCHRPRWRSRRQGCRRPWRFRRPLPAAPACSGDIAGDERVRVAELTGERTRRRPVSTSRMATRDPCSAKASDIAQADPGRAPGRLRTLLAAKARITGEAIAPRSCDPIRGEAFGAVLPAPSTSKRMSVVIRFVRATASAVFDALWALNTQRSEKARRGSSPGQRLTARIHLAPAPATLPLPNASTSADWSISPPRETLTIRTPLASSPRIAPCDSR